MIDLIDLLAVIVRAASFVTVLQAAGTALFAAVYRDNPRTPTGHGERLGERSGGWSSAAIAGVILSLVSQLLVAARMSGGISGVWDSSLESLSWYSSGGSATTLRVLGLLAILIGQKRGARVLSWLGVAALVVSFALTGHTASSSLRPILAVVLSVHIAVVVFWFGALPPLWMAAESNLTAAIALFSKHATLLVPLLALAGIVLAWVLLPNLAALTTPYGMLLVGKIGGFIMVLSFAAYNKLRLVPAMQRGERDAFAAFARTAKIEYALIAVVLCVTATMTTLFSPE